MKIKLVKLCSILNTNNPPQTSKEENKGNSQLKDMILLKLILPIVSLYTLY